MPEIGEVYKAAHHLRLHLLNRTISQVKLRDSYASATSSTGVVDNDAKIFLTDKTGLTAKEFAQKIKGRKVVDVGTQGKYFWVSFSGNVNWLGHFGMAGWIKFKGDGGAGEYRRMQENGSRSDDENAEEWPPKFWKFILCTSDGPEVEAAFVDKRRFSANRLIEDCPSSEMRLRPPLSENGPDPYLDRAKVTLQWFAETLSAKKVPIKALLLDQHIMSGVGNWVADEILFQARVHPEQISNTLNPNQVEKVHACTLEVCKTSCELLADSSKFPSNWLMLHRWDKGKNTVSKLPTGEKITHITVGGRTSAFVPSLQKKTGPVAADVKVEEDNDVEEQKSVKPSKAKKGGDTKQVNGHDTGSKKRKQPAKAELDVKGKDDASTSRKRTRSSNRVSA